jgi:FkbM family methyltransferase
MGLIRNARRRKSKFLGDLKWERHKLSDWYYTFLSTKTREYDTRFGYKLRTRGYIANRLMVSSEFETTELAILKQLIHASDVFIDIGANIGYYTCLACSLGKKTLAFEPQPQNLACLLENLLINGWQERAEVFAMGLADRPGVLTLYGASGPSASLLKGWAGYSNRFRQKIPVNTLDNILSQRFGDEGLTIKIDVEGAEYDVLMGAVKTLRRKRKPSWFLEICLSEFHPGSVNRRFEETFRLFLENGYNAYVANDSRTPVSMDDVRRWTGDGSTQTHDFNYFFVPPDSGHA